MPLGMFCFKNIITFEEATCQKSIKALSKLPSQLQANPGEDTTLLDRTTVLQHCK